MQLADLDPSPTPVVAFAAMEDDGTAASPDTTGAVGPAHVLTLANGQGRIHTRDGVLQATFSLDSYFVFMDPAAFTYDPRCLFDPYAGRWMMTGGLDPDQPSAGIVLAVSATDDPLGDWYRFYVPVDAGGTLYADSPSVGFNRHWVVIQANIHNQATGEFLESQVVVFDKSDVYAGGNGAFTRFRLPGGDYGDSQVPATTLDPDLDVLYLVKSWNGNYLNPQTRKPEGLLRVFTISGAVGAEVLTPGDFVNTGQEAAATPFTWADFSPTGADAGLQRGSVARIQLGSSRMQNVVYRGGSLWCAQTVLLPAASPTRSGAQWWEIFPDGRLFQRHLVDDAAAGWSYAYPSLAVNNHYDVLLGYSGFSGLVYPSAYFRLYPNDGLYNNPLGEYLMRAGQGSYVELYAGQNRWGDWSTACVDPLNDGALWTAQEYALAPTAQDTGRWGIAWASVVPEHDLHLSASASTNGVVVGQLIAWTLTLSNRVESYAYDAVVTIVPSPGVQIQAIAASNATASVTGAGATCRFPVVGTAPLTCVVTGLVTGASLVAPLRAGVESLGVDLDPSDDTVAVDVPLLNAPPVLAPVLRGNVQSGFATLRWPVGYRGFVVESRAGLTSGDWVPVAGSRSASGSDQVFEVSPGLPVRYYRLRWTGAP